MKRTLTARFLKSIEPSLPGKRRIEWDAVVPGMGVRVTDRGHVSFVLGARFPGSKHFTPRELGAYGAITLEQARDKAREWLGLIAKDIDPRTVAVDLRIAEQRKRDDTFTAVAEKFLRLNVIGPDPERPLQRRGWQVAHGVRKELIPRWGERPITSIAARDVISVLDEVVARGAPYQAHNLHGYIRRLFNWAIARGDYGIARSPCDRMRPADIIGRRLPRLRVLTDDELRALWSATDRAGYPFGPLYRLLVLTALRKNEVAKATWTEFDLKRRIWTIPPARMKGNAPHVVPLTAEAVAILEGLPRFGRGDFLFSTTHGQKPVSGFAKAKTRLDTLMDKPSPWRTHDIRRTVRTHLSTLQVPEIVRELILAHAKPGLHRVYDQHLYADEKRHALTLWAARLRDIVEPPPANVVALRGTAS
jgi:integrase